MYNGGTRYKMVKKNYTFMQTIQASLLYQTRPSLTLQNSERESNRWLHEMLTNQILLFHFETVATPWLQYVQF